MGGMSEAEIEVMWRGLIYGLLEDLWLLCYGVRR